MELFIQDKMAALEHSVRRLDIFVRRFAPDKNILRSAQECPARRSLEGVRLCEVCVSLLRKGWLWGVVIQGCFNKYRQYGEKMRI